MADIQFPALGEGKLTAKVLDNSGSSTSVFEASKPIHIEVVWKIDVESARVLAGRWEVAAYAESIGPGQEMKIGPTKFETLDGRTEYGTTIVVPAGTFPDNPGPGTSGVYKIVTVLLLRNFGKVTDVVGIDEAMMVRIG